MTANTTPDQEQCAAHGERQIIGYHLDVWLYVKDILDRLLASERDLASLRAESHPEALRPHRLEEARYRAEAKSTRHACQRLLERKRSERT